MMETEKLNEALDEIQEKAADTAQEKIEDAAEIAEEIKGQAAEEVQAAAEEVQELTETVNDQQKELEWKLATKSQLDEMNQKLSTIAESHQAMITTHQALMDQLARTVTPPPVVEDAPPEVLPDVSESEIIKPSENAETQEKPPKRKAQFL